MTDTNLDTRLRAHGPLVLAAAALIADLLAHRRWVTRETGASRMFSPPTRTRGEMGLRIHLESFDGDPALEFALKELRLRGSAVAADRLHQEIQRMEPRARVADFPSVPLVLLLDRWERGGRDLVRRYALALERAA